jgi:hypothetical protein
MRLRYDKNGKLQFIWTGEQLKRRRMKIRAGIGLGIRSVEFDTIWKLCQERSEELLDEWYNLHIELDIEEKDHAEFFRRLKEFAWHLGVRHWLLKPPVEDQTWRSAIYDRNDGYDDGANWWKKC